MFPFLSLTVAIKDYLEIIHQLIALDATSNIKNYTDIGPVLVYTILSLKQFILSIFSFNWLQNLWTLPVIVPDITSAMISEISVLDGYFHTAFTFLDNPTIPTTSLVSVSVQKLIIGFSNSLFLCLPTSVAHIITLRRFLIQGLEAGYISGLGVVSGNVFFLASVIFGWRFFLIPWISLDIFRYVFGFILLVKYIWDSANERRMVLEDLSKWKIFLITFLLSLTEQTSIFPFISNLSFGTDASVLESFSANSFTEFIIVHSCYLLGILIGSLSLLHLSCWFWENPAFQIYMWAISSFKVKTGSFYKYLNFGLLYLTMLSAISSIPYFGLDYTLTSPFGLVFEDRILEEKVFNELSFLNTGPTDRNTRRNRGRHPRRSRWNRRTRKYRSFQTNLYEKESYDWMTIEDLNFGFDRQWIHRKMRNHRARYRLFPGKLTRSLKDQARKAFTKRHAFFDTTENYFYHPSFHEYTKQKSNESTLLNSQIVMINNNNITRSNNLINSVVPYIENKNDVENNSALNKFNRKVATKIASGQTIFGLTNAFNLAQTKYDIEQQSNVISSQRWKRIFTNIEDSKTTNKLRNFYQKMVLGKGDNALRIQQRLQLSKKDRFMLRYRTFLYSNQKSNINKYSDDVLNKTSSSLTKEIIQNNSVASLNQGNVFWKPGTLLHPIKYYLQKEQAYNKKLQYYGVKNFRTFAPDYSPPLFRVIMQRYFYSYKPTKRWSRTLKGATMRRYLRKSTRKPRILQTSQLNEKDILTQNNVISSDIKLIEPSSGIKNELLQTNNISLQKENIEVSQTKNLIRKPTHFYSMKGKRASRYRYQIYRDVLQHWYYSPLNRILPKIDIDSFIRRQPANHFITPTEERILHLRRFLVSEHYDTLRWYTAMQQYTQMKNRIGGTKSLSSRSYNQQFFGNFKKIRHLFAVTPSLNDQPILTFDQPLYNEYENSAIKPIIDTSIIHEELLADDLYSNTKGIQQNDILNQSLVIIKEYLNIATPIRQELIGNYLKNKNYWELTQFLYKGQKTRGFKSITNERNLIEQEKNYLLTNVDTDKIDYSLITNSQTINNLQQSTVVALLRKWKQSLGNQRLYKKALKNQFKNWRRQKKRWRTKLEKYSNRNLNSETQISLSRLSIVPSGLQKAIKDNFPEKLNIGQVRTQSSIQLENEMKNVLVKLRDLKTREEINSSLLQNNFLSKLRKKLQKQIINTNEKVQTLYVKTKNKTWWNKKSTENWRPTRRRLDIDSLRKRIKRKSDQSEVLERTKQDFYTNYYTKEKLNNESFNFNDTRSYLETSNINESNNDFNWQKLTENNSINIIRQKQIEKSRNIDQTQESATLNWNDAIKTTKLESSSLLRQFKRKRVSRRRGRKLGPAGYSRRPNLSTLVKRQINARNNVNLIRKDFNFNKVDSFELIPQKLRYFRKRKHRDWEKKVKPNNGIKTGKYRKRKLSFYGKVRSVQKQLIRVRWKLRLQKWWWQFLPSMQGAIDAKWQVESDKNLISILEKLTEKQILKRDQISYTNTSLNVLGENRLQIGDQDFKPLQIPEAIRIRNELEQQGRLKFGSANEIVTTNKENPAIYLNESSNENNTDKNNIINQLTLNVLGNQSSLDIKQSSPKMQIINAVPFYAGWDESLRKLVITNVLFSLRDASFEMKNLQKFETLKPLGINELEFTNAPLKAQNGATTVYWQTPFTTYETDQFFTLGVDGFSPLQWRRFNFKQSIVKNWKTTRDNEKQTLPILVKTLTKDKSFDNLLGNNRKNIDLNEIVSSDKPEFGKIKTSAIYRRRQKRYKRVRRHPRAPVWYPSGTLISDVLPTQYVYAFDYTARRPRDRYIQRRWRKRSQVDSEISSNLQMNKITDFTLRRRPNGRRKYHRRGGKLRSLLTVAYPMRRKMVGLETEMERWRPERIKKETGYATKVEEVRKRRGMSLRRRKLRQVFPKISRYRPLNGGFVWPGEYLMLEQSKVPKLKQINLENINLQDQLKVKKSKSKKLRRKIKRKSRNIAQWNIQPKKYLLQKHNIKVLKKKLQKSYRTNQLQLKLRQLSLTV